MRNYLYFCAGIKVAVNNIPLCIITSLQLNETKIIYPKILIVTTKM